MSDPLPVVYVVSDSAGETAEAVVRAAASQFNHGRLVLRRVANVHELSVIEDTLLRAVEEGAVVAFTIVVSQLKEYLRTRAEQLGISTVDILSPMMCALETVIGQPPYAKPGLVHQLDAEYFRRIEAIEFAVKYDDGREARGLHQADVVLVGVSRTSKTPLSIYLAHKGLKVANVPLVPEVNPSAIVNLPAKEKIFGLTIRPDKLALVRQERLKMMGLGVEASYASYERILDELEFAESVMKRLNCPVVDVSDKAVEETAAIILEWMGRGERYL
ncbi:MULTISPECIES: pyruvate, water dikinase regulatory protein [Alicyclobacillus]|uniref:Putative pyruvate, phosphate dikinase regulatory protein n=1 Tax=Alicyclobacillus acidoterrestris (strain ATCC 49025 / DSM 3922 / CIP 106132 / NCIMB 13137 / GD3B) TaxID=1356854 RepID=T0BE30_ALIAG|nr:MULTISPECIES: pyruvate, water dikinase regulatory protein [Alicyclobacillus]EPZ42273.1 hypothetical protein N007_15340 [Alicyclobacillus acidoterrestris ATCC 49025]UNO48104.1 kinase/pyrophosphorylase [Alicyclobacillus acidoterrestris]